MATTLKIPLQQSTTDQLLQIEINNIPYTIGVLWNERFQYFSFSLSKTNDSPILKNIKMVKNYPLTGRFKDTLKPIGDFYLVNETNNSDRPLYDDLGVKYYLYYYESDQIADAVTAQSSITKAVGRSSWDGGGTIWDGGGTIWDV